MIGLISLGIYMEDVARMANKKYGVDLEEAKNIISCIARPGESVEEAAQRVHAIAEGEL